MGKKKEKDNENSKAPTFCPIHLKIHNCSMNSSKEILRETEAKIKEKMNKMLNPEPVDLKKLQQEAEEGTIQYFLLKAKEKNESIRQSLKFDTDREEKEISTESIQEKMARIRSNIFKENLSESPLSNDLVENKDETDLANNNNNNNNINSDLDILANYDLDKLNEELLYESRIKEINESIKKQDQKLNEKNTLSDKSNVNFSYNSKKKEIKNSVIGDIESTTKDDLSTLIKSPSSPQKSTRKIDPKQLITDLTVEDLEKIITKTVKKVLKDIKNK